MPRRMAAACGLVLIASVVVPAATTGTAASAMPLTCQAISGHVHDAYSAPLAGVTVDASAGNDCTPQTRAVTDAAGAYMVYIEPSLGGTAATASKAGFASGTRTLSVVTPSGAVNDFQLLFDIQPTISPSWVRSGQPVTFSARSTAPPNTAMPGYVCDWGRGDHGELGTGTTSSSNSPAVALGPSGQGSLGGIEAVSADVALRSDGSVVTWGFGGNGELGNGTTGSSATPVVVSGVGGVGTLSSVTAVAGGTATNLALRSDGTVVAWGFGGNGELGNGTTTSTSTPVVVTGVGGSGVLSGVAAVAAGQYFNLALRSDGSVVAWGAGPYGELGNGATDSSSTPVVVQRVGGGGALTGIAAVAAGGYDAAALTSDGTVVSWGFNANGQLGNGTTSDSLLPTSVAGVGGSGALGNVAAISTGLNHSVARLYDGTAVAWGFGANGELGNGSTASSSVPVAVSAVGGSGSLSNVAAVAAGGQHSLALLSDGTVAAWGYNSFGQIGAASSNTTFVSPVLVAGVGGSGVLHGVTRVAAGIWSSFVIDAAPGCVHSNQALAQLGDGTRVGLLDGSTGADGYTTSVGKYTVPSAAAEGVYAVKFCASAAGYTGNCDQGAAAGPPTQVTPVPSRQYGVDNTPPYMRTSSPTPYGDLLNPTTLSVTWTDDLSGVDPLSVAVQVDGVSQVVSAAQSGGSSTGSVSTVGITPGVHLLTTSSRDLAGNLSSTAYPFTIVTVTADSASATLAPMTVSVNPAGNLPPPSTVTFNTPQVQVGGFGENLNATSWAGYGTLIRPFSLTSTQVVFKNETGLTQTVQVTLPSANASHQMATLAPSGSALRAIIPPSTATLPPVVVNVPLGYNTQGSTATLVSVSTSLGATTSIGPQILGAQLTSSIPVAGTIGACMEQHPVGSYVYCQADQSPTLVAYVQGVAGVPVASPVQVPQDPGPEAQPPPCSAVPAGCVDFTGHLTYYPIQTGTSAAVFGCPLYTIPGQPPTIPSHTLNLCTGGSQAAVAEGFAAAYLNAWVFGAPGGAFPLWQQDHLDLNAAGDQCPNGRGGSVHATAYRTAANGVALDGSTTPLLSGTFRPFGSPIASQVVQLGATTGPTDSSSDTGLDFNTQSGQSYQLQNAFTLAPLGASVGRYQVIKNASVSALGLQVASTSATANLWQAGTDQIASSSNGTPNGRVDVTTGVHYFPSSFGSYAHLASLAFQFIVDFSNCT